MSKIQRTGSPPPLSPLGAGINIVYVLVHPGIGKPIAKITWLMIFAGCTKDCSTPAVSPIASWTDELLRFR